MEIRCMNDSFRSFNRVPRAGTTGSRLAQDNHLEIELQTQVQYQRCLPQCFLPIAIIIPMSVTSYEYFQTTYEPSPGLSFNSVAVVSL